MNATLHTNQWFHHRHAHGVREALPQLLSSEGFWLIVIVLGFYLALIIWVIQAGQTVQSNVTYMPIYP